MVKDATKQPLLRTPSSSSSSSDDEDLARQLDFGASNPELPAKIVAKPTSTKKSEHSEDDNYLPPRSNDNGLTIMGAIVALLVAGATYLAFNVKPEGPVVELGYSNYLGKWDAEKGMSVFYGVKYAASTAGENRWRAPQPPRNTKGEGYINVTVPATYRCPQTTVPKLDMTGRNSSNFDVDLWATPSEDCLDLSIYTPLDLRPGNVNTTGEKWTELESEPMPEGGYPVVVVLHAGGYGIGSRNDLEDPTFTDLSKRGIVTVLVNYRLGAFGFLAGEDVKAGGELNVGLLDQRAALKWVQEYIHKFGGDPKKVTLLGQSAGAGSAVHHMLSQDKEAEGLFRDVILSSPYAAPLYNYNDRRPIQLYKKFLELAGCNEAEDKLKCLREKPMEVLVKANVGVVEELGDWGDFGWFPVKDDSEPQYKAKRFVINDLLSKTLNSKDVKLHGERLLVSHMPNEGFLFSSPLVKDDNVRDVLLHHIPELSHRRGIDAVLEQYPAESFQNAKARLDAITGDLFFNCLNYWLADAFSTNGKKVWEEQFMIPPYIHGMDIPYSFKTKVTPRTRPTFEEHSGAIVAFVKNGDPNNLTGVGPLKPRAVEGEKEPERDEWKAWTTKYRSEKVVGVGVQGNTLTMIAGAEDQWGGRCDFWKEFTEKTNL
ncbi:alpha/beta-hydrolase [Ascobolus immersus RN42]|uniref:Carboxylic ester hydrolase n=1 Tax=Ascobolus immersus RN42 TaxID=1160509 RepID=A0A3N4I2S0_ASCIM|nr:alpha/beta-hydrolase [Ascobolus immersus RN42]